MENTNNFTYNDFKKQFNIIMDKVQKIKTKKIFLEHKDINELELLLKEVKSYKVFFYTSNKRSYFSKLKIEACIFLLQLEIDCGNYL